MPKTKLLLVIADSSRSGAPTQVLYLAEAMRGDYLVTCLCPPGWLANALRGKGLTVYTFPSESAWQVMRWLRRHYQQLQPDIIHLHGVRAGVWGRLAAWRLKPLIIYTEHVWTAQFHLTHLWREKIQLGLLKFLSRFTRHTVAVSRAVQEFLIARRIVDPAHCSVQYGGIEMVGEDNPVQEPIIGTLGSLNSIKGTEFLLRALPQVVQEYPKLICRIGGIGKERVRLGYLCTDLGLEKVVEWVGEVEDKVAFYRTLRLYVQPSLSESFGLAILEAMSAGIPVIATEVGGIPEIVSTPKEGVLVPVQDRKALTEAIIQLLKDTDRWEVQRKAGLKRAQHFNVKQMTDGYQKLYHTLLK